MKYAIQILTKYDDGDGYRECQTIKLNFDVEQMKILKDGVELGLSIGGETDNYKVNIILVEGDSK